MNLFDRIGVLISRRYGTINKHTQNVTWTDDTVSYTSEFIQNVNLFIAREFSKLDIDHRVYQRLDDGRYLTSDKLGSDLYEVLNFSPNGALNNTQWKRQLIIQLINGNNVYLKPEYNGTNLESLSFTTSEYYTTNPHDVIVITSPFNVSNNTPLYDAVLTRIGTELDTRKMKGFIKINAIVDAKNSNFKAKALEQLETMQGVSAYNGMGVLDNKTDVVELRNTYQTIDNETITFIKKEILNGYGINEALLTGNYTAPEYQHFFDNVMAPVIKEIETELTYKLLTNNKRINDGKKNSFERVVISVDTFKFASVSDLIKLASANTNGAYLTVNEIRQVFGKDPIVGGDVFRTNLNSTEITYEDEDEDEVIVDVLVE